MSGLGRVGRWAVRLVPDGRRDWAEALWAEADQVPPGLARLVWLAGGARLIARQVGLASRAARGLAFAAVAAWIVHVAWPGPASNPGTAVNRLDVGVLLPVLAVLPLLARWRFGPAASRLARALRYGGYAAVLALTLASAAVRPMADNPAATPYLNSDASTPVKDGMIATWLGASVSLLIVAGYVAIVLALTARRARVRRGTLAVGTGTGLVLGAVMYAIFPIGLSKEPTNPRLPALPANLLVALAWVLLFGGPVLAAVVAARRCRGLDGVDDQERVRKASVRQAAAAGLLATVVGALTVTVLGTATVALMPRAGWVMGWLYPGQHLTAATAYLRELTASVSVGTYRLTLAIFPFIGLVMGVWTGASVVYSGPPQEDAGPPSAPSAPSARG